MFNTLRNKVTIILNITCLFCFDDKMVIGIQYHRNPNKEEQLIIQVSNEEKLNCHNVQNLKCEKISNLLSVNKKRIVEEKCMSITSNWIARVLGRVSRLNVVLVNTNYDLNNMVRVLVISQFNFQ